MKASPDPLDELLSSHPPPPALSSTFQADVERRLRQSAPPLRLSWWESIERLFAQPAFSAVFVCACVLLGLLLAEIRVSSERQATHNQVVQSYLQLLDPRLELTATTAESAAPNPEVQS